MCLGSVLGKHAGWTQPYLEALGYVDEYLLASSASDESEYVETVVTPLQQGETIEGTFYKSDKKTALTRAVLVKAFKDACALREKKLRESDVDQIRVATSISVACKPLDTHQDERESTLNSLKRSKTEPTSMEVMKRGPDFSILESHRPSTYRHGDSFSECSKASTVDGSCFRGVSVSQNAQNDEEISRLEELIDSRVQGDLPTFDTGQRFASPPVANVGQDNLAKTASAHRPFDVACKESSLNSRRYIPMIVATLTFGGVALCLQGRLKTTARDVLSFAQTAFFS